MLILVDHEGAAGLVSIGRHRKVHLPRLWVSRLLLRLWVILLRLRLWANRIDDHLF